MFSIYINYNDLILSLCIIYIAYIEYRSVNRANVRDFEALLKGVPNKKMQALRDMQLCEGAPWRFHGYELATAFVEVESEVEKLRIPQALPGHKIENLEKLEWRDIRDNFADYFYGIELIWNRDPQEITDCCIFGHACKEDADYLRDAVTCVAQCL